MLSAVECVYRCPRCTGDLTRAAGNRDSLECTRCGVRFPFVDALADFSEHDPKFLSGDSEYDQELEHLLADARAHGWFESLAGCGAARGQRSRLEYATSASRTDFKFLLPLSRESCVLDIGGGHGLIAMTLARSVAQVHTIEKIRAQGQFIALRARQEGVNNVHVSCGGASCRFPYRSGVFDLIVANGVFEWVGYETAYDDVARRQGLFLQEILRMLKPGGGVWLTTKNRYSLSMLFSRNANNNYMPLATVLPNAVFNSLSRVLGRGDYLSQLKSAGKYQEQFSGCGFSCDAIWVPQPSVRYPVEIVNYERGRRFVSSANYQHASSSTRCMSAVTPWGWAKRFALNHAFVLRKSPGPGHTQDSIVERIMLKHEELSGGRVNSLFCPPSNSASSSVVATIFSRGCWYVVKMTRCEGGAFLRREVENLKTVGNYSETLARSLPLVVGAGEMDGFAYMIARHCQGLSSWSSRFARGMVRLLLRKALADRVLGFVVELAARSKSNNSMAFERCVADPFARMLSLHGELRSFFSKCLGVLQAEWSGIPNVFSHGDMHIGNFVLRGLWSTRFTVLDWESGTRDGLPCVDLQRFAATLRCSPAQASALMRAYCAGIGIDRRVAGPLALLHLVQSWEHWRNENALERTPDWCERQQGFDRRVRRIMAEIDER